MSDNIISWLIALISPIIIENDFHLTKKSHSLFLPQNITVNQKYQYYFDYNSYTSWYSKT